MYGTPSHIRPRILQDLKIRSKSTASALLPSGTQIQVQCLRLGQPLDISRVLPLNHGVGTGVETVGVTKRPFSAPPCQAMLNRYDCLYFVVGITFNALHALYKAGEAGVWSRIPQK